MLQKLAFAFARWFKRATSEKPAAYAPEHVDSQAHRELNQATTSDIFGGPPIPNDSVFPCRNCGAKPTHGRLLQRRHGKQFYCETCARAFTTTGLPPDRKTT